MKFDPALIESPLDVAVEFLESRQRIAKLREQVSKLEHEIAQEDETLGSLDRWLGAVFEANPDSSSIRISFGGQELVLVPNKSWGFIDVIEPGYTCHLKMAPFPAEPDFDADDDDLNDNDSDIDCEPPSGHPFALVCIEDFHDDFNHHDQSVS